VIASDCAIRSHDAERPQINAAGVNVERFAERLNGHRGTIDVPSPEAIADRFIKLG